MPVKRHLDQFDLEAEREGNAIKGALPYKAKGKKKRQEGRGEVIVDNTAIKRVLGKKGEIIRAKV